MLNFVIFGLVDLVGILVHRYEQSISSLLDQVCAGNTQPFVDLQTKSNQFLGNIINRGAVEFPGILFVIDVM
jgi:hypothetical protein